MRPDFLEDQARTDWRADLLLGFEQLMMGLRQEIAGSSYLNAFLLAVAIQQVVEDAVQPESLIDRMGTFVGTTSSPGAHFAGRVVGTVGRGMHQVGIRSKGVSKLTAWQEHVDRLVEHLATITMTSAMTPHPADERLPFSGPTARSRGTVQAPTDHALPALLAAVTAFPPSLLPMLRDKSPVIPSCFQTFDLGLKDVQRLGERIAEAAGPSTLPLVVVGVRTSGSYLAPLLSAVLRNSGLADVDTITLRPGIPVLGATANRARNAARRKARFIVTDDPPVSGSSLLKAVGQLQLVGVPQESVSLAYPRFIDTPTELRGLHDYPQIVLPWEDWEVHPRLLSGAVRVELQALLGDAARVASIECIAERRPRRAEAHVRAVFRVELAEPRQGDDSDRVDRVDGGVLHVAVEGVGLGYYGEHVTTIADAIGSYTPRIFGLREGLLFREWLDDGERLEESGLDDNALVAGLAAYVAERRTRLAVPLDRSLGLAGSRPVWETAAVEVSQSFGRAWPIGQVVAVNRLARRILRVSHPAVIDGTMDLENWFVQTDLRQSARLRSVGLQRRAYWHHGLSSYDPVFDLAGAMDADFDVPVPATLLGLYTGLTGDAVSPERWMLLRLAQLWGGRRRNPGSADATRSAAARVLQGYFANVFLRDVMPTAGGAGPLCALDVDGVLESDHLGFPSLTAASAFALRALRLHGYRPVLATGRSIEEVRERCLAYGLVGGVAEYGSALYLAERDQTRDLVPPEARQRLAELRAKLATIPGIAVDPRYRYGVRAWATRDGGRHPLPSDLSTSLMAGLSSVRIVAGEGQTDFVAATLDKGSGLRHLTAELARLGDAGAVPSIELAVGDTESDAPMLSLAGHPAVPRHASASLNGDGIWRAPAPYQAGLGQAVDRFLQHVEAPSVRRWPSHALSRRIGELGCEQCRLPQPDPDQEALLLVLSVAEAGRPGIPHRALRAAVRGGLFRTTGGERPRRVE